MSLQFPEPFTDGAEQEQPPCDPRRSETAYRPGPADAGPPLQPESVERPLGLYVHIPFCQRKCPYCDFNTYARLESLYDAYVEALCLELSRWGRSLPGRRVTSVFLGGGTPTVLDAGQLARIVETIHTAFQIVPGCEITSEANPGAVDRPKFAALRKLGINRLSMGVQSFQPDELRFLGRIHDADDARRAFAAARKAGFDNINLDFIFGLPDQSLQSWRATVEQALELAPEHLSLYSLIVEPNTPLHHWVQSGRVAAPDDDQAAAHYELALDTLAGAGYLQYEVSNWARPEPGSASSGSTLACRHNLIYWRNQEYLGVGPGAHSHLYLPPPDLTGQPLAPTSVALRWGNRRPVPVYIAQIRAAESVIDFRDEIDGPTAMGETMMLGLRLVEEGVSFERFRHRHQVEMSRVYGEELTRLLEMGLLVDDGERVRLSRRGLMVGNQVFARFLP